jgi:hypothetical protein
MRNEHSDKYTPRSPHCPSCAQLMPLARTTSRFGNLPDLYIFECRACGVSHIDAVEIEAAQMSVRAKSRWVIKEPTAMASTFCLSPHSTN